ncbi:amino acid ABC transporter permease [uncultured Gulosibacter sp.]|uniref:amino acid ABC transporter permease n=1 Tax=uncultured Gulosibacter sp. TaxID=1339167 RepID=UPI00288C5761|nr:amino acid ABC transporter permease [uncultured Gulosibacter sp.]
MSLNKTTANDTAAIAGEPITAVPLRHPWRVILAVVLLLALALFVYDAATREQYRWPTVGKYLFDERIWQAAGITLALTVLSMLLAVIMGLILAVMRLSENPVLKSLSWLFLWLFRGTPVYVQLVFWGLLGTIYKTVTVGVPFTDIEFFTVSPFEGFSLFWLAVLGLAFNEAAYMAEIIRSGILSVDRGQEEAAKALGMTWRHTMLRIVIPQSMRVIIPPTGNELISMLKTTSLVTALGYTLDLYARSREIAAQLYEPVPLLIVASIWYLAVTSILMVGQHYLEAYFARGIAPEKQRPDNRTAEQLATGAVGTLEDPTNTNTTAPKGDGA